MNVDSPYLGLVYTNRSTPTPVLTLAAVGENMVASWALPSQKFLLQQTTDVNTTNWVDVGTAPALDLTNLHYRLTLPKTPGTTFYRLISR